MTPLPPPPAALVFAPPIGRPIHYRITEHRPAADGERRFTLHEEAVFTRDSDGYLLTLRQLSYSLQAPPAQKPLLDAAMAPMVGKPVRIRVSHGGVPERVVDGPATWAAFIAGMRAVAAKARDGAAIAKVADAFEALPAAARDAQLLGNADDIIAPHLPPVAPGRTLVDGATTVARDADAGGAAHFHRRTLQPAPAPASGTLSTAEDVAIAADTGLVRRRVRRVTLIGAPGAAPAPVSATETDMVL